MECTLEPLFRLEIAINSFGYIDFGDSTQLDRYSRVSYTVSQLNLLYHRDAYPRLL